ncbi:response regulator transcription factor [Pseudoflavitalea sp. X16]|uniref:LytR/AlgR family response regulator transcription factor n=1 Tax=Paraflavitalea devenefica TaxID=2716334 RepID=UPI001423CDB6|nr:LytTR family DNA-binding domain-containing protein [Paraflavitalea devenefica]NII26488.1 response regulator transcription factor [Paraflavitalea devenefica]
MKLRCIIVDDEPFARHGLAEDIRTIDFMEVTGIAESALQAMELLVKQTPDLIFLDIEMPKLNGFDLLRTLEQPPMIILTTAYAHYAPESYDLGVIDYLLKPISFNRLLKACHKAKDYYTLIRGDTNQGSLAGSGVNDYFFVKCNGRQEKICLQELLYIEAADNYIFIHTTSKKLLVYHTLKNMEEYLPANRFIKVHKSFIVAFDKVDSLEGNQLFIGERTIPVGRNFRDALAERVAKNKLPGARK